MSTVHATWVACAPGLEKLCAEELSRLGLKPKELEPGGMTASMSVAQLYATNLRASIANRISVRIGKFHASEFWELEKRAERMAWHAWVPKGGQVAFRVTSRKSKLYHNDAIAERLGALVTAKVPGTSIAALAAEDEETPSTQHPALSTQLFLVRIVNDEVTISADSSGDLLYRRGWRQEVAKAPLRETLAAAMLAASGWDGASPLHDPFCGSGTIIIEAARRLRGIAAGRDRSFAFERWPTFDPELWMKVRADTEALRTSHSAPRTLLLGTDRDPGAIRAANANARRAGVADLVQFVETDLRDLPPAPGTQIVTNPPYGVRVDSGGDLVPLFARLGRFAKECGGRLTFLCPDHALTKATGLPIRTGWRTTNGGIPVECCVAP